MAALSAKSPGEHEVLRTGCRSLLLIGYGNTLRRDDGVGPKVAEAVAALDLPGVEALGCTLLTPELAEPISRAGRVLFVDASVDGSSSVELRPLTAAPSSQIMAHAAEPQTLLALARDVFSRVPLAWMLTIPIETMEVGEELSAMAKHGMTEAVQRVKELASVKSV